MSKTSCISHPPAQSIVVIREDYLRIADGNHCAAALLNIFEYWTNIKAGQRDQAVIENQIAAVGGASPVDDTLWIYKSIPALKAEMMGLFGDTKVSAALKLLEQKGFIESRNNPKYGWDRTLQYLLKIEVVQALILRHGSLESKASKVVKVRHGSLKSKAAIPETTAETTTETTTESLFAPTGALLPEQEKPDAVKEQPGAPVSQNDRSLSDAQPDAPVDEDVPPVFADAIEGIPDDSFYDDDDDDDWDDAPRKLYECTPKDIAAMLALYYEWVPVKPLNARRQVVTLKEVISNTSNRDCAKALWQRGVRLTDVVACLGKMRRTPPPGGHEPMTFCFVAIKIEEWARKDRADNWYSEKFVSICPKRPGVRIEDWNSLAEFKAAYPDGHPDYYVEVPPPYINPDAPDEDDWDDYDDESTLTADEIAAIYADAAGG